LPATSIGGNPLGPRFSGLIFGVALGLMIATHARLQRALPARARRFRRPPHVRAEAMPELPGRIQPGMGRADLPSTLGMSSTANTGTDSRQYGALVPHTPQRHRSNRPGIIR
jgi:hypothetical protein